MIDLYTHPSPNTYKISICLEELALSYRVLRVDLPAGEHKQPSYLAINPTGKVPAIVDHDSGQVVFESGAILLYLADKAGGLIAASGASRWQVITWLFFHAATAGPILAQRANFEVFAETKYPAVIKRFKEQSEKHFEILDTQLRNRPFLCDHYSVADIAHFGWIHIAKIGGFSFETFVHLTEWYDRVAARPAVKRGLTIPAVPTGF